MIYLASYWLLMSLIFWSAGAAACRAVAVILRKDIHECRAAECLWAGVIVTTALGEFWSLFGPVNAAFRAAFLLGLAVYLIWDRKIILYLLQVQWSEATSRRFELCAIILAGIYTAFFAVANIGDYDTGLYHASAIRWIKEYGLVLGLGNLHSRLAFNPSFFVLAAIFDCGPFENRSFHLVNSFLFLVTLKYLISATVSLSPGNTRVSNFFSAASLFLLCYYAKGLEISSVQPNFTVVLCAIYVFTVFLDHLDSGNWDSIRPWVASAVALFSVTVKLNAAALVVFPAIWWLKEFPSFASKRKTFALLCLFTIPVVPWLFRNILISGWLVYPFPYLDLFSFDWKIPKVNVVSSLDWTRSWALQPRVHPADLFQKNLWVLLGEWYMRHSSDFPLVLSEAALALNFLAVVCLPRDYKHILGRIWPAYVVAFAGLAFWLFSAPDHRFGLCYFITAPALWISVTIQNAAMRKAYGIIACASLLTFFGLPQVLDVSKNGIPLAGPLSSYPEVQTKESDSPLGLKVHVPTTGDRCWNANLLCVPGHFIYMTLPGPSKLPRSPLAF